jgi:uncharacterized membrane protein
MIFFAIVSCGGQLQWSTHIQIEVFADGSATWVVQQRTVLTTDYDEAAFWEYLNVTSVDEVSNTVHSMVNYASLVTGRSMRVENLEVNANVSSKGLSKEGIIQYQFDWLGFAEIEGEKIKIGDALSGELDLLRDDVLTIKYPSGYTLIFLYPPPDETRESEETLSWFGPRNFGAGEPNALLAKKSSSWTDFFTGNITLLSVIVAAVLTGLLGYFLGMKRALMVRGLKPKVGQEQAPLSDLSVEDDEEKVIGLLVAAGGRMRQSTIAKQCGFSKSKASELLSVMERKGIVTRRKMGRGKIVALVEKRKT